MDTNIISAAISGVAVVAAAVVGVHSRREHRATREQITNGHETNIRDDIDRVLDGIEGIRADQREEREARREGDAALARRIERLETAR